jgi:hypothetical protein
MRGKFWFYISLVARRGSIRRSEAAEEAEWRFVRGHLDPADFSFERSG